MNVETVDHNFIRECIRDYYTHEPVGGFLHIVLDDYNVEDSHIRWCLDEAERFPCEDGYPWCHLEAELIGAMLLAVEHEYREDLVRSAGWPLENYGV